MKCTFSTGLFLLFFCASLISRDAGITEPQAKPNPVMAPRIPTLADKAKSENVPTLAKKFRIMARLSKSLENKLRAQIDAGSFSDDVGIRLRTAILLGKFDAQRRVNGRDVEELSTIASKANKLDENTLRKLIIKVGLARKYGPADLAEDLEDIWYTLNYNLEGRSTEYYFSGTGLELPERTSK